MGSCGQSRFAHLQFESEYLDRIAQEDREARDAWLERRNATAQPASPLRDIEVGPSPYPLKVLWSL